MLLAAAASFVLQAAGGDVAAALERLKSASAAERAAAQLVLARSLRDEDLARVRDAAEAGDPEVRRRLAIAIADDDAKISLAVALAADPKAGAAEVGRAALEDRLARWCPGWTRPPVVGVDAATRLVSKPARGIRLDPRVDDRRLDVALDQLARLAPGAVPLVLDPDLALSDHPRETSPAIEGFFTRTLAELVRVHRAELEGFAILTEDGEGADDSPDGGGAGRQRSAEPLRPWFRIRRAVFTPIRPGTDWIVDWCVGVVSDAPLPRRAACARAVAATGWPGGVAWLERRAFPGKDEAALEGVILAAGRGQPAPSIARPEIVRDLLARVAADPARGDAIVRAIAAVGPTGPKGEDLAALVAEDLVRLPPKEAWVRLAILEGMRSSSRAAQAAIDALLAGTGAPPPLRFQALRARAATDPGARPRKVEGAPAALAWALSAGLDRECVRLLVALGVPPPAEPSSGQSPAARLADLEWTLFGGTDASAAARLRALAADASAGGVGLEALSARTRELARQDGGQRLARAIAAARSASTAGPAAGRSKDDERLERLEILSRAGDDALRARWTARLAKEPAGREDLLALGALAAGPTGDLARATILRALASPDRMEDAIEAAKLALESLWSALKDEEALAFSRAVAEIAATGPKELRTRLKPGTWPPRRPAEHVNAAEVDRTMERSGL